MQIAKLTATTRGEARAIALRPDEAVTLGRSSECDVPLRDAKVSRRHCQLSFAMGQVVAVDLGSSHGLQHRGGRKPLVALAIGDGFHLGDTFVRFQEVVDADEATLAAWFGAGGPHERRAGATDGGDDDGDDVAALADDLDVGPPSPAAAAPSLAWADGVDPAVRAASPAPAPARSGWDAFVPPEPPRAPARDDEPLRLQPEPRPRSAPASKAFAARLAADSIVFSIHMTLCVALLVALKLLAGFDLYRAFGMG